MKKTLVIYSILLHVYLMNAQNIFPSSGNVGIGTTNPTSKLFIEAGHLDAAFSLHSTGNWSDIGKASLTLWASEPGVTWTGAGIGNNVKNYNFSTGVGGITVANSARGGSFIRLLDNTINFNLISYNNAQREAMTIIADGNVGIGTTTPTEKLEISGNTKINGNLTFSNYGGGFFMVEPTWIRTFGGKSFYHDAGFMRTDGTLQVGPNGDRFVVNSNGNVGVGTTTPQSKLDIDFGGEPKSIKFLEFSNNVNSMNSLMRFTWYNDTADFGMVRSGSTPIEALAIRFNNIEKVRFNANGNVAVQGKLEAKEIKVTTTPTADFVFGNDYKLPTLQSVEKHIKDKKHLPEIASGTTMKKEGVNVGEFQIKLLQKIEELTLYAIEQQKRLLLLEKEIILLKLDKK